VSAVGWSGIRLQKRWVCQVVSWSWWLQQWLVYGSQLSCISGLILVQCFQAKYEDYAECNPNIVQRSKCNVICKKYWKNQLILTPGAVVLGIKTVSYHSL